MLAMLYFGATQTVFRKTCSKHTHFVSLFKPPQGQRDLSTLENTHINLQHPLYLFRVMTLNRSKILMCGDQKRVFFLTLPT